MDLKYLLYICNGFSETFVCVNDKCDSDMKRNCLHIKVKCLLQSPIEVESYDFFNHSL